MSQHEIAEVLRQHLTLPGTTVSVEAGTIVVRTPKIIEDSAVFTFQDNADLLALYNACRKAGVLNIDVCVPKIHSGVKYSCFRAITLVAGTPEVDFFIQLGQAFGRDTTIG